MLWIKVAFGCFLGLLFGFCRILCFLFLLLVEVTSNEATADSADYSMVTHDMSRCAAHQGTLYAASSVGLGTCEGDECEGYDVV